MVMDGEIVDASRFHMWCEVRCVVPLFSDELSFVQTPFGDFSVSQAVSFHIPIPAELLARMVDHDRKAEAARVERRRVRKLGIIAG